MAFKSGVDIIYIPGIAKLIRDESMLDKLFDSSEMNPSTPEHLAGVIAAKEAFFKTLGIKPKFREIKIAYEASGKPKLIVSPQYQNFKDCDVSISHDNEYAIAFVVLEQ